MARLYLIIILVGVFVGAMLPSGSRAPHSTKVTQVSIVEPFSSPSRRSYGSNTGSRTAPPDVSGLGTTIYRGANGHFFADAQVNGMTVHFLIDTGASGVALTTADAQRAGLQFSPMEFSSVGSGASGEVRGKMVTLDRVTLDGHEVRGVDGVILEGGEMSLLGQSFLSQMGTIEISGDRMVIR